MRPEDRLPFRTESWRNNFTSAALPEGGLRILVRYGPDPKSKWGDGIYVKEGQLSPLYRILNFSIRTPASGQRDTLVKPGRPEEMLESGDGRHRRQTDQTIPS